MVQCEWESGTKFNYLMTTGKSYVLHSKQNIRYIEVICTNCGKIKWVRLSVAKNSKSCGCVNEYRHSRKENLIGVVTHGLTKHPLYKTYRGIQERCYNPNHDSYHRYGGIGVIICDEWKNDFKAFYDWCMNNGWEKGLEIDKDIKYNTEFGTTTGKIYSPEYCMIITRKVNAQYKSTTIYLEYEGEKKTLNEWAKEIGVRPNVIAVRLFKKWSVEKTLTTPLRKMKRRLL